MRGFGMSRSRNIQIYALIWRYVTRAEPIPHARTFPALSMQEMLRIQKQNIENS